MTISTRMNVKILDNAESLADAAAAVIYQLITRKPNALLALATGHSPTRTYERLIDLIRESNLPVSSLKFVALDEWVGIAPTTEGSCAAYLRQHLFEPLGISPQQVRLFDALSPALHEECVKTEAFIQASGGIDLITLGVGMNGHLGFNEPGTELSHSHVIELDETTRTVGKKYFRDAVAIEKGITLGLKSILAARTVVLIANGRHKAAIVKTVVENTPSPAIPATILHNHPDCTFFLDDEAAALLTSNQIQ
jgi:galactosamine-6-phosphate isomerase